MNLIFSTICSLLCFSYVLNMKLQTFESALSPKYLQTANGIDILRILKIDRNKTDYSYNDNEEADILKRKMKNSDIKIFEKHLKNYLAFIKKYNKDISFHLIKESQTNSVKQENNHNKKIFSIKEDIINKIGNKKNTTSKNNKIFENNTNKKNFTSNHITEIKQGNLNHSKQNKEKDYQKINGKNIKVEQIEKIIDETIKNFNNQMNDQGKKINKKIIEVKNKNNNSLFQEICFKNNTISKSLENSSKKKFNQISEVLLIEKNRQQENDTKISFKKLTNFDNPKIIKNNNKNKSIALNDTKIIKTLEIRNNSYSIRNLTKEKIINKKIKNKTLINKYTEKNKNISYKNLNNQKLKNKLKRNEDINNNTKNIQIHNKNESLKINTINKTKLTNEIHNINDDVIYEKDTISNSLINQINSFFMNYGNNYNNIDVPLFNFDLSNSLPQELINQIKDKNFNLYFDKLKNLNEEKSSINDQRSNRRDHLFSNLHNYFNQEDDLKFENEENFKQHENKNSENETSNASNLKIDDYNSNQEEILDNDTDIDFDNNNKKMIIKENKSNVELNNTIYKDENNNDTSIYIDKPKLENRIIFPKIPKNKISKNDSYDLCKSKCNKTNDSIIIIYKIYSNDSKYINTIDNNLHYNQYQEDLKKKNKEKNLNSKNATPENINDSLFDKITYLKEKKYKNSNKTKINQNDTGILIGKNQKSNINKIRNISLATNLKICSREMENKNDSSIKRNLTNISNHKGLFSKIINNYTESQFKNSSLKNQTFNETLDQNSINIYEFKKSPKINRRNLVQKQHNNSEQNLDLHDVSGQSLDQIYMKLKMKELNDDFERRQKILDYDKKLNIIEAENAELNIYRKIINISISLIVTGLLMGILLGLILVMYFNSRK